MAQNRFSLLSQHGPIALAALLLGFAELPLAGKKGVAIEVGEDLFEIDLGFHKYLTAPERWLQGWLFGHRG